ncbi:MAG: T9SS type A sorting domain-containing protein [Gammaproteobacteria bacterium]|nr:T9SS type A sorting domain-containing protein [Gammaproteobacteria bacterium]NIW43607.1 T9SS type A sorting domain-containing protein [Gammaproteobacteria bacterium]NIX54731.1 T9SS type A sorting domain-containing protein [candidate division Zixibacteria bacterium]
MQNLYGTQLWSATYNGSANGADSAVAVTVDQRGNIYIAGHSMELNDGAPVQSMTTISYDQQGNQRWIRHYLGIDSSGAHPASIQADQNGGVYVGGTTEISGQQDRDYVLVKYDTSGLQKWAVTYNGSGNNDDELHSLALDNQANIYLTGQSIGSGTQQDYATIRYTQSTTAIPDLVHNQPEGFNLYQNYPNPFNPTTTISFSLPSANSVKLTVYNALGQVVATLIDNQRFSAGRHEVNFSGINLPSGIYYYRIQFGSQSQVSKMVLMK